jgi:hypothetical protein
VIETILANRGALITAALTVLRAWHVTDARVDLPPFGSLATGAVGSARRSHGSAAPIPATRC